MLITKGSKVKLFLESSTLRLKMLKSFIIKRFTKNQRKYRSFDFFS